MSQQPRWASDDKGNRARLLWEMSETEGWKLLVDKKLNGFIGVEMDRAMHKVCSVDSVNPNFYRGKLDTLRKICKWVENEIEHGIHKE